MGVPHSPLEDAKAAMALYKSVRPEWEKDVAKAVSQSYQETSRHTTLPMNPSDSFLTFSARSPYSNSQNSILQLRHMNTNAMQISPHVSMQLFEPNRNDEYVFQSTYPRKLYFSFTNEWR
jgi:hypothetical protein